MILSSKRAPHLASALCALSAVGAVRGRHIRGLASSTVEEAKDLLDAAPREWLQEEEQFVDLLNDPDLITPEDLSGAYPDGHALSFTVPDTSSHSDHREHEHDLHRELASPTKIKVRNKCSEMIQVTVATRQCDGSNCYYSGGQYIVNPASTSTQVVATAAANAPEFFLRWVSTSGKESRANPNNGKDVCFSANLCLKHIRVPNANAASYTYPISCGASSATANTTPKPPQISISIGNGGNNGGGASDSQPSTPREQEWLDQHNSRRRTYHRAYGKSYKPLEWSRKVQRSAQNYADKLAKLSGCRIKHGHDGDRNGGENLAHRWGSKGIGPPTPYQTLWGWAEREEGLASMYQKLHWSQVIWRTTKYVGCGEASKTMSNGQECHIQVCRYIAPGNCDDPGSDSFVDSMLSGSSSCGGPSVP